MSNSHSVRRYIAAATVAALVPAAVVTQASATKATAAKNATVTMKAKRFHPASVTITKGGKVTWIWADKPAVPHNIVAKGFKGVGVRTSGRYTVTFKKKGTFSYVCTLHPGMVGKVIVK